ncbi:MAG: transporter, partial [Candidatus Omnitrophica bacterium]|nr:transporter [Candidatus Omnitrophota bacterium]
QKGDWMVAYRYMRMDMDSNYSGSNETTVSRIHGEFPVAPTSMDMEMHMLSGMYGLTEDITLMLMVPYNDKEMDHRTRMGREFTTRANGLGDIRLSGLFAVHRDEIHRVHVNLGVSFPSGSIDERDRTPMGPNQILPYPMQLGSGTYDLLPGVTYAGRYEQFNWGVQLMTVQRLGENDRDYSLGNRYEATSWVAYQWTKWAATSFRLRKSIWGDVDGADRELNPAVVQTADPTRQAGKRLDALLGLELNGLEGTILSGHRLAFEVGFPLSVDVNGPQLVTDLELTIGWQMAW